MLDQFRGAEVNIKYMCLGVVCVSLLLECTLLSAAEVVSKELNFTAESSWIVGPA